MSDEEFFRNLSLREQVYYHPILDRRPVDIETEAVADPRLKAHRRIADILDRMVEQGQISGEKRRELLALHQQKKGIKAKTQTGRPTKAEQKANARTKRERGSQWEPTP